MRKPIIAGNWKMNKTAAEARELVAGIVRDLGDAPGVDVVLCPPFTALSAVSEAISDSPLHVGAQNMHSESSGAYTGEIAAEMLRELYCHYVILGHSERRSYFGETDETVNKKAKAALAANLIPIVCVGETLEQREANETAAVIEAQIRGSLAGIEGAELAKTVVAYEPVWAIGTGLTASPEQAQEVHAQIRGLLVDLGGEEAGNAVRIQYGGSMKPGNAAELLAQPDIDGGLIGGAALDVRSFIDIIAAAR